MPYQMIYSSRATESMTAVALAEILSDAHSGNEARDVTGALVYCDGVFLQILEGEEDVVRSLAQSIASDSRHDSFKMFHEAPVETRVFEYWRMAYVTPSPGEMAIWAGLEGTETIDELMAQIHRDVHRVPRILVSIVAALAARAEHASRD
jgi:hypothetical protein